MIKNLKIFIPILLMILIISVEVFAEFNKIEINLDDYPELRNRVNEYYSLEKEGGWNKAYEFRTPNYKRTVAKPFYMKSMNEDNKGWELLSFEILSAEKISDDRVSLSLNFVENAPLDFLENLGMEINDNAEIEFAEESIWLKIDGTWYCYEAGSRSHLPLNDSIVVE